MPLRLEDLSLYVACPTTRPLEPQVVRSFLDTQELCLSLKLKTEFVFIAGSLVHHARILAANRFLASGYNRLVFIDSDIVWEPRDFIQLIGHSLTRDCVVGLYPRRNDEAPGIFVRLGKDREGDLRAIEATGLGFACIQRRVIEELSFHAPERFCGGVRQPCIFRQDDDGKELRGEDYAFWADVRKHGFQIWADTNIAVGHIGPKVYRINAKETLKDGTTSQPPIE